MTLDLAELVANPCIVESSARDDRIGGLLKRHWDGCIADNQDIVHEIYHDDCEVHWPQSREWVRGKKNLQALRESHPNRLDFRIDRVIGSGDLWVTEYEIAYDGRPVNVVSIMEFRGDKVARETHYFADPFEPPEWRSSLVEVEPD